MIVSELASLYLDHAVTYYVKPRTGRVTNEYGLIERALDPMLEVAGSMPIEAVNAATLSAARRWLLKNTENCRNTVNGKVSRIVRMFTWGADPEQRLVPASVVAELKLLRPLAYGRSSARETDGLEPVSRGVVMSVLASLMDPPRRGGKRTAKRLNRGQMLTRHQLATMIELQLETGMRSSELCGLAWERIDRSRGVWVYRPAEHKSEHRGKDRLVLIRDVEQALIRRWMRTAGVEGGKLFALSRHSYRRAIERACERAGVGMFTPHQLRHTFATETRRASGIDAAQVMLGHSSVKTTERYAGVDLDAVIAKLGKV
jgi:integrase